MDLKTEINSSGKTIVAGIGVGCSQFLVSAEEFGVSLPENFGVESKEKADLLERRLSRLENALGLSPLGDR